MELRLHTVGASGSGTTTLARALAEHLGLLHFDADDYLWEPTDPPFILKRSPKQRLALLETDLSQHGPWVLSGFISEWGQKLTKLFTHVIYISLPRDVRIRRLEVRERKKFGGRIADGGDMHQQHVDFLEWAKKYDDGGPEVRSRRRHETWFQGLRCPLIRLSGELRTGDQVREVLTQL